jgi:hypothetical protein
MSKRERMVVWKSMFCSHTRKRCRGRNDHQQADAPFIPSPRAAGSKDEKQQRRTNLSRTLHIIIATKHRVRRRQHAGPRVQDRRNTRFGDGDRLLLHGLVNGDTILVAHLVKLVDADDAAVGEDHRAAFEEKLSLHETKKGKEGETGDEKEHGEGRKTRKGRGKREKGRTVVGSR